MSALERWLAPRATSPLSRLVRAQAPAAAATALYRNQLAQLAPVPRAAPHDGARDFDFLFGRWRVRNERLRTRLAGSDDWQRFDAIVESRPILGGLGNIDEFVTDEFEPTLYVGMALRLYEPGTRQWSIYWASNRTGVLEPPVVGGFRDGVGRFDGEDVCNGVPVRVRFDWSRSGDDEAHWAQAFSADGGRSWETNGRLHLRRLAAAGGGGES